VGLDRRCVGIQLLVQGCNGFVVGFTNNGVNGGKRETFDDRVDKGWHVGWVLVGETGVVAVECTREVVAVVGETGCCRL
jgi:hypothetical protein